MRLSSTDFAKSSARKFSCEARLARTVELYDGLLARVPSLAETRGVEGVRRESA
jgi:hypothetical protein